MSQAETTFDHGVDIDEDLRPSSGIRTADLTFVFKAFSNKFEDVKWVGIEAIAKSITL